jgi:hypothetical protein
MDPHGTVKPSGANHESCAKDDSAALKLKDGTQSCFYRALFFDIASSFPNCVRDGDLLYLQQRICAEGPRFYLDTLPQLGKAFECSLVTGEAFKAPDGWKLSPGTRLPKFMNSLFTELFEDDGSHKYKYPITGYSEENLGRAWRAVTFIRQVCLAWSKVELAVDVEDKDSSGLGINTAKSQKVLNDWLSNVVRNWDIKVPNGGSDLLYGSLNEARRLLRLVFSYQCAELTELRRFIKNPWGRQGPGAVAEGEVGCEKWSFKKWPGIPAKLFSWRDGLDCEVQVVDKQDDARLCLVPKDFRGPRVICIEPKENQFAQQGLMDILYRLVHACALTKRSINFLDTDKSRSACYDYRYATIDLKAASDTIHLCLARLLLPRWVFKLVTRYRSRSVRTPKGDVRTRCLATMGNATCFPLETLVFWALSLGTLIHLRDSFHPRQQKHLNLDVRVFGDDIIVPLWGCEAVVDVLAAVGLTVNAEKTCSFSLVRESCGEWVFAGRESKIVKFHSLGVEDYRSLMQWSSQYIDLLPKDSISDDTVYPAMLEEILGQIRLGVSTLKRSNPRLFETRYNTNLQRSEFLAPVFVKRGKLRKLTDASALYAWHVGNDRTPFLKGARKRVYLRWQDQCSSMWINIPLLMPY